MAKQSKKSRKSKTDTKEYVPVVFAEDVSQAEFYEDILKSNDIPVIIREHYENAVDENEIAVMVPEEYLDEAHVVIESQDAYDDFYDYTEEDEEDEDFDSDFIDDDF